MSEMEPTATVATMYTPLIPKRPRLRFLEGAGDGAAGDGGGEDKPKEGEGDGVEPDADDSALGDAGKQALARMKAERATAKAEARAATARAEAAEAALANKDKPAEEQALEAARAEARAETLKAANVRIVKSELKAAATGRLADPTDAALYINLDDFAVSDDGEVDSDALNEAITELLTRKPHLSAAPKTRFEGGGDGGAKAPAKQASDIDEQIAAATAAKNFALVATLKTQKSAKKG